MKADVVIEIWGPQPGTGPQWRVQARDPAGAMLFHTLADRETALAALAEYVEQLHQWSPR